MDADHKAQLREIALSIARGLPADARRQVETYDAEAFLCPNCWVKQGARSQLYWVSRDEVGDRLHCDTCHGEFVA